MPELTQDYGADVKIYHNPKCSKSRRTLELIRAHNIEPVIIEYLKTPLDRDTLIHVLALLDLQPAKILRSSEPAYRQAGLNREEVTDEERITAMIDYPILIQRPIVVANAKAIIGRPPENVLAIIDR